MTEYNDRITKIGEDALALNKEGYSCAQSVFGSLCEQCGVDKKTGMQLSSAFCGGIGGLKEVCGAFASLALLTSLKYGYSEAVNPQAKSAQNAIIKKAAERFIAENGSLLCRDIAPNDEAKKTACPKAIASGAMLAAEILGEQPLEQRMHLKEGKCCGRGEGKHEHAEGKCCGRGEGKHEHGEGKHEHAEGKHEHAEGKCCGRGEGRRGMMMGGEGKAQAKPEGGCCKHRHEHEGEK